MLDKWADFLISAVKYNAGHDHIVKVKTHEDKIENVGNSFVESREEVVSKLKKDNKYCTITKGKDGWKKGEMVQIFEVNNKEFIKTVKNNEEEDNLGELPEFNSNS